MKILNQNKKTFTIILVSIIAVILISGGIAAYMAIDSQNKADTQDINSVNYDPPTEQEISDGQNAKKDDYNNVETKNNDDKNTTDEKLVDVGISYAGIFNENFEVRAFTNGVVEAGTCTVTITKNTNVIKGSSGAFIDASSTQCQPILIPKSQFESGTWLVEVTYSSPSTHGTSDKMEVKVP